MHPFQIYMEEFEDVFQAETILGMLMVVGAGIMRAL